ncbi:head maturation protease, ClpP-related [Acidaminococcus sp.]|uniref:head maturation protease, ClpP-related n=1 Tax=Acidaminococcus sp. TaxID=1872103 RepID=UPI003D7D50DC
MQNKHKFLTIRNEAGSDTAEILLYGEIDSSGDWIREYLPDDPTQSAGSFRKELQALDGKDVLLRINSPGGDVFQAQAIYNVLKTYSGHVSCHIDGICASAATLVACAADSITMPENALYMIHNPASHMRGTMDRQDLDKAAEMLDKVKDTIVAVYMSRCKDLAEDDIRQMMDDETWMTANEAHDKGFVDGIDDYGVDAGVQDNGLLVVNSVVMPGMHPDKNQALQRLCAVRAQKNEVKFVKNEDKSFMDQLKDFFAARDAEAQKANAEANRIKALDALKGENPVANALVDKAKEQGVTAEQLHPFLDAVASLKVEDKGMEELKALITDQLQSGATQVKPGVEDKPKGEAVAAADKKTAIDEIVNLMDKKRG